jgi:DNA polymerase-1
VKEGLENKIMMLLNIHDAVLFEIDDTVLEESIVKIKHILEDVNKHPFNFIVPFVAEYSKGRDWREATYG